MKNVGSSTLFFIVISLLIITGVNKAFSVDYSKSSIANSLSGPTAPPTINSSAPVTVPSQPIISGGTFFPLNNAENICTDTILKISFDSSPVLGTTGSINIYNASKLLIDKIDLADRGFTYYSDYQTRTGSVPTSGDLANTKFNIIGNNTDRLRIVIYYPVIIIDNTAYIFPHNNKLSAGTSYYVTVDESVFAGAKLGGAEFRGIAANAWRFKTKASVKLSANINVDASGNEDFMTIQGAVDSIPADNNMPYTINVKTGIYRELIYIRGKNNITITGADRNNTIITYNNCENYNIGAGNGSTTASPSSGGRSVILIDNSSRFTLDSVSVINSHPHNQNQGKSDQAETIYIFDASGSNCTLKNSNFASFQDTMLLTGTIWVYNCFITGDVDFIWGYGPAAFFENCEIKCRYRSFSTKSYIVQSRCGTSYDRGYVFYNCLITQEQSNVINSKSYTVYYLARSGNSSGCYDRVAYLFCRMDSHIAPSGWYTATNTFYPSKWFEYQNMDLNGKLLDVSTRAASKQASTQLTGAESIKYTKAKVLGGWNPAP